ncbi:MAG: helix-turn-helix domain-containing protein [Gammaproteobacteria bacterium]|nr:helix-turn-helix domain-containing protein [Gammaproteobacteria bacterium]MCZ6826893.1 helix-turn-helix domain-containing protein [Gammaproteobacteria bacterium]
MKNSKFFPIGIGALSRRTDCKIETIRYYERQGLLPEPPRSVGGHRLYKEDHLKRLTFIRRCRNLGFTMAQIRQLLGLVDEHQYSCQDIKTLTMDHVEEIREKIDHLKRLEQALLQMAAECSGESIPSCPVIDALYQPLKEGYRATSSNDRN